MKTAIYLRKSRADEEAEKRGEYETLSRHRSALLKIAREKNLNIVEIKEELVSGESISYRPKMMELLEEVKQGMYDAVLVMDIDRLGRGNMQDQGLILDTFKKSKTKIITPRKIYDLSNEFDEEYSEFEAFMARKELKLITRRMQRGRIKSVEEGKFIASSAPYGYKFEYINGNKDRILVIDEEKSTVVKIIYDMYLQGIGAYKISNYLNELGYRTTTGRTWYEKGIRDIIKNKVYCGYVVWNKVERKRNSSRKTPDREVHAKGNHKAIISESDWNKAQSIRLKRSISPLKDNKVLANPLAGLVKCKCCNHTMTCQTSSYKNEGYVKFLVCKNCYETAGVKLYVLEEEILNSLNETIDNYRLYIDSSDMQLDNESSKLVGYNKLLHQLEKESITLVNQKENLHDLLEKGIYDVDTYLDRSKILTAKIENNKQAIEKVKIDIEDEENEYIDIDKIIPMLENVLELYPKTENISEKNKLLKSVIDNIIYYKEKGSRNAIFEMDIKLKSDV
ncbi:recombinase family protein [Faecalimicrobium sp. JNUCC 81]